MTVDWSPVVAALRGSDEIALACHVNPDGDALGSLLALTLGLRKMGKATYASWGTTPASVPPSYKFLPSIDTIVQPGEVPATAVFVALDCGAGDRLGELEDRAHEAKKLINIDHHPGNEEFGDINVVDTTASSTAELVAALLREMEIDLDTDIATCLYTGVVTDTGRFQYSNSTPDTLRLAADLLELNVPAPEIALEVFESAPFGYLKLLGRVLERAQLFPEERFVYSWITSADLIDTGVGMDETEKLIDLLRGTRDAVVAAMFKEQADGRYRVSMRSKGSVKVNTIAQARGGGGHDLAAGFTAPDVTETAGEIRREVAAQWTG